jgi:hypothetical protein
MAATHSGDGDDGGVYKLTGSADDIASERDALTLTAPPILTGPVNGVEALTSLSVASNAYPATGSRPAEIRAPHRTTFGATGATQRFTVGIAGYYDIAAAGAPGCAGGLNAPAGLGAPASGDVYLQAGALLEIVVGGACGSLVNAIDASTIAATQSGDGFVTIRLLTPPTISVSTPAIARPSPTAERSPRPIRTSRPNIGPTARPLRWKTTELADRAGGRPNTRAMASRIAERRA